MRRCTYGSWTWSAGSTSRTGASARCTQGSMTAPASSSSPRCSRRVPAAVADAFVQDKRVHQVAG